MRPRAGAGAGARVLMVTPYPPVRDGIAAYALQEVARLRAAGHHVEVLSPGPSAAHHHLDLRGVRGAAALGRRLRSYARVVVQFHPDVFYPPEADDVQRRRTSLALAAAFRLARDLEVRVHEVDYARGRGGGASARAERALWRSPARVVVHTPDERVAFHEAFGVDLDRIALADHGAAFVARTNLDRAGARARLGLDPEAHLFLCIGFIQPHKGFDRAVRAFAGLGAHGARLAVVGSVRVDEGAYVAHRDELAAAVAATEGAELREGFVDDEAFDQWLVAADTVVLPYRHIWSSSVMERARLFHRPAIVTRVGGLAAQAGDGATVVDDDEELAAAMRAALGLAPVPGATAWQFASPPTAAEVMAEVRARAGALAGTGDGPSPVPGVPPAAASAALRRLGPLARPAPTSSRPGVSALKRIQRRLMAWQVDPLRHRLDELAAATLEAVELLERRVGATPRSRVDPAPPDGRPGADPRRRRATG